MATIGKVGCVRINAVIVCKSCLSFNQKQGVFCWMSQVPIKSLELCYLAEKKGKNKWMMFSFCFFSLLLTRTWRVGAFNLVKLTDCLIVECFCAMYEINFRVFVVHSFHI